MVILEAKEAGQLNEALAINPDYVEARLQAGIALLRSHDPAGAIAHLRFAADHQPDYPDLHLFLGLAYLRDGRIEKDYRNGHGIPKTFGKGPQS